MGRPPTKPKRFKDGFYIEVRNKGANAGMKIHFDTQYEMEEAAAMYGKSKEVVVLGEHKKDKWLNEEPDGPRERKKKEPKEPKVAKQAEPKEVKVKTTEKKAEKSKAPAAKAAKTAKPAKSAKKK
ncbi:MAG TPA: hypothetical protein VK154_01170 [Chitinophagales bacterium]|nr:hypothetical protein [Chitinophagales bacterium]